MALSLCKILASISTPCSVNANGKLGENFSVRKGFHPKLGARPMRDAVEKLVGDAVSECLLDARPACGALAVDEVRDCLTVL